MQGPTPVPAPISAEERPFFPEAGALVRESAVGAGFSMPPLKGGGSFVLRQHQLIFTLNPHCASFPQMSRT